MHIKKSGISLLFSMLICLLMVSCGGQSEEQEHGKAPEKIEVPETYEGNPIIQAYLHLKDALVLSDAEKARVNAKMLVASLDNMGDDPKIKSIREYALKIYESSDLNQQREIFKPLSDAVADFAAQKNMGIKLYKQFCPMAFDNAGGFWLSAEEEINNPYFGDKMLHCGVVKEEI